MVIDELWHDSDGDCTRTLLKDLSNLLVFDSNHVLTVHFTEMMVNEQTITGGREGGKEGEREGEREEGEGEKERERREGGNSK